MTSAPGERLPYLLRALKAPRILDRLQATAERARAEGWPHEQFLEALCEAEVFAREASGARQRIRNAGFPAPKTLEDFDFAAQPAAEKPLITHLAQLAWIDEAANVCFLGPPGTGKAISPRHWRSRPARPGTARCSPPPSNGSTASKALSTATASTTNSAAWTATDCWSSTRSATCPLEHQAANLLFALVARRYERGSIIVTSNRGFEAWGEIVGDAMVAAALIDRLVHHATMITLKGKSYRLRERAAADKPRQRAQPTELS